MSRLKRVVFSGVAALVLAFSPAGFPAQAQSLPHVFVGAATIDGGPAAEGAVVAALVDGDTVAETALADGKYTLALAPPPGSSFAGKMVAFAVDGYPVEQIVPWEWGQISLLNLAASAGALVVPVAVDGPPADAVQRGDRLSLTLTANLGRRKIAGAEVRVGFDPQVFEPLLDPSAPLPEDRAGEVRLDPGAYSNVWTYRSPSGGSPESGELDSLVLRVKAMAPAGGTALSIRAELADAAGRALQPEPREMSLSVRVARVEGDFNSDGLVDIADLAGLGVAWGLREGEPGFDHRYDLDSDGIIGEGDLAILSRYYLEAR